MVNAGEILISANAEAYGEVVAYAAALGGPGVEQLISANNGNGSAGLINEGTIAFDIGALAEADNSAFATAVMYNALNQGVFVATGDAFGELTNSGDVMVGIEAVALGDNVAGARATATHVIGQNGYAVNGGNVTLDFANEGLLAIAVDAAAAGGSALAQASLTLAMYQSGYAFGGDADVAFVNDGTIAFEAAAIATGQAATAVAFANTEIIQLAVATGGDAAAVIDNAGEILIHAGASGIGTSGTAGDPNAGFALAVVENGIVQGANALGGAALAEIDNGGTIAIVADAHAEGDLLTAVFSTSLGGVFTTVFGATATAAINGGIVQYAYADSATGSPDALVSAEAELVNEGEIAMVASAAADGDIADANASVVGGIKQYVDAGVGPGSAVIANSGSIVIGAQAEAAGVQFARADATIYGAFLQSVLALTGAASAAFVNDGEYTVSAVADAVGTERAVAFAQVMGGLQDAQAMGSDASAIASFVNSGDFIVHAFAQAENAPSEANTAYTFANAAAEAIGLYQFVNQGGASFANSGTFDIRAIAELTGPRADGFASAIGVTQTVLGDDASVAFANDGEMIVVASIEAEGELGAGFANALAYRAAGESLAVDGVNAGTVTVAAIAQGGQGKSAGAAGFGFIAEAATTAPASELALLSGTFANDGDLLVLASASGGSIATVTTGGGTTLVPASSAYATGMFMVSGANAMTVSNSGLLQVDAVTANGGSANATGVLAPGNGSGAVPTDEVFTFTNDGGTIIVRESVDGGESWRRGMAIDVTAAPNASVINLSVMARSTAISRSRTAMWSMSRMAPLTSMVCSTRRSCRSAG